MFKFVVLSALVACALGAAIPDGLLPQLDGRIVGGNEANINYFPYQVSLQKDGSHSCGGSIYSKYVVVTAAHCLQNNVAASTLKVRAGSTSKYSGGSLIPVASYKNHPEFNPKTMVNDIAIVRLAYALTMGNTIMAVGLASTEPLFENPAVVSGWGAIYSDGPSPSVLHYVDVFILDNSKCSAASAYGNKFKPDSMICAGASGKDACQGDSGGPLFANGQQVGVVSWGYGCADPRYPGVYSNVAALRLWVVENAHNN